MTDKTKLAEEAVGEVGDESDVKEHG